MADSWVTTCPLHKEQVTKAVKALKSCISKSTKDDDKVLLEEHNTIQMQITLHKIPALKQKRIFIDLPHTLHLKGTEICLITKDYDEDDTEKSEDHCLNLLRQTEVSAVTKVIPLKLLKKDYRSYESRRKLVDMYDLFLCDRSILYRMPALLGKTFFEKRKDPWGVDLSEKSLKKKICAAVNQTRWYMSGNGSCSLVTVAKTTFSISQIVENVMACAAEIAKSAPRGWHNVASLKIKTDNSLALPVYYNDNPIDVDDLDLRELNFLLLKKKRREDKRKMYDLIGLKNPRHGRRVTFFGKKKESVSDDTLQNEAAVA